MQKFKKKRKENVIRLADREEVKCETQWDCKREQGKGCVTRVKK